MINMIGKKCGRLLVIKEAPSIKGKQANWECICECGNRKITNGYALRSGSVRSCGCLQIENRKGKRIPVSKDQILKRFLDRVGKGGNPTDCWKWTAGNDSDGYANFAYNKQTRAHRWSYQFFIGKIPKGLSVCHTCDNRECTNPKHLFIGTPDDNSKDMVNKGRQPKKLSEEDRKEILRLYKSGMKITRIGDKFSIGHRNVRYSLKLSGVTK
jgi:hypothetical protein